MCIFIFAGFGLQWRKKSRSRNGMGRNKLDERYLMKRRRRPIFFVFVSVTSARSAEHEEETFFKERIRARK